MDALDFCLVALALFGHFALCAMVINRLHSTRCPRRFLNALDKVLLAFFAVVSVLCVFWLASQYQPLSERSWTTPRNRLVLCYAMVCWLAGTWVLGHWVWRSFLRPVSPGLVSNDTINFDVAAELGKPPIGNWETRLLSWVPGNQFFKLDVNIKAISLPNLDKRLDGLAIAHISDLHFAGGISKPFFDFAIDRTNELDADLVAVTGDIVDSAKYLEWIPSTLARLQSRHGVYFVLGNHDKRIRDVGQLRKQLTDAGLIDLGGVATVLRINEAQVLLAGNELPWFGTREQIDAALHERTADLRVLLSHSPDQLGWARRHNFHLMLAGHNHGGQVRLPLIGPLGAPSRHGVKYASGLFFEAPTTLHVSRGIAALHPLRINCPPEVTKLVLRACERV